MKSKANEKEQNQACAHSTEVRHFWVRFHWLSMLRIKRLYATICALLVMQATYCTILIIKPKEKNQLQYHMPEYHISNELEKGVFFLLQKYKQINRLRIFI